MADWIALSDRQDPNPGAPAVLDHGVFVLEFTLPILDSAVLLHVAAQDGTPRTFSVFFDPAAGLSLLHRQGAEVKRHVLTGPLPQKQGPARLSFTFDAAEQVWHLEYEVLGEATSVTATGTGPLPISTADLQALCVSAVGTRRHPAVLWFGVTQRSTLPARAPWLGLNTFIDTRRGPVRAGLLRPGDMVATLDHGYQPLRSLVWRTLPSRGSFAPVVLRSPFFGLNRDILVSSDQLVLISGASVEYLYGVEEALISAASLCDGKVATKDERRSVTRSVALTFDHPYAITADGCCLMSVFGPNDQLPRRALRDFEALPLLTLLGRTALRHVA